MRTRRGRRGGRPRLLLRSAGVLGLILSLVVATPGGTRPRATAAAADGSTALAAVLLAATTSTWSPRCGLDHPTPRPAATTRCTVQVAGTRRAFVLSTPSATGRAALVVAFHGLRQTAATFAGLTGLVASARG